VRKLEAVETRTVCGRHTYHHRSRHYWKEKPARLARVAVKNNGSIAATVNLVAGSVPPNNVVAGVGWTTLEGGIALRAAQKSGCSGRSL
jgi:hypothetical protein